MLRQVARLFSLLAVVVIAGCATSGTDLIQVWKDPVYAGGAIGKIMILGMSDKDLTRRLFENQVSALFRARGVEAVPSYHAIPLSKKLDKEAVKAAVDGRGYDAVLVTHLLAVDTETEYVPGQTYVVSHWGGSYYDSFYPYYSHTYEVVHQPGYLVENKFVRLETNIYDVASESLMWASVSETFSPETLIDAISTFGEAVLRDLETQGLVP